MSDTTVQTDPTDGTTTTTTQTDLIPSINISDPTPPPTTKDVYFLFSLDIKFRAAFIDITKIHVKKYIKLPAAIQFIAPYTPNVNTLKSLYNDHGVTIQYELVDEAIATS